MVKVSLETNSPHVDLPEYESLKSLMADMGMGYRTVFFEPFIWTIYAYTEQEAVELKLRWEPGLGPRVNS